VSSDPFVELRGDVLREHVDVMDAVAQATPGASRMSVLRQIIGEWVDREKHRSMLVQRVCGGNGTVLEADRNRAGSRPERARR